MATGIIGGTGVYDPDMLSNVYETSVKTAFGNVDVKVGSYNGRDVVFICRHGFNHSVPPHLINYKANIAALKLLGVKRVITTSAVGTLNESMPPGSLILLDQFIDLTSGREATFFNGGDEGVIHLDYTNPYCESLKGYILRAADDIGMDVVPGGCYVCTQGPRFETAAEIRMMKMMGADVVGMTNVPEVVLAREAEMCYASIAMATNWAAGMSDQPLTHEEVVDFMSDNVSKFKKLILRTVDLIDENSQCGCNSVLSSMKEKGKGVIKFV